MKEIALQKFYEVGLCSYNGKKFLDVKKEKEAMGK